jgi:hypothetical protein
MTLCKQPAQLRIPSGLCCCLLLLLLLLQLLLLLLEVDFQLIQSCCQLFIILAETEPAAEAEAEVEAAPAGGSIRISTEQ